MKYVFKIPEAMLKPCDQQGKVERFEYDTFSYEGDNRKLHKGAWVYLPYGYDEGKKYNILYLLHGGGVTEDWWFKMFPDTVTILDNMIAQKVCDPCIIVTPSYYRDGNLEETPEYVTEYFHTELRNDLIPGIESRYATYVGDDISEGNLISTRDHRAFAGLSLGSMTTYRAAMYHNFDLFAWYGPFSGCCGPKGDHETEVSRICETLKAGKEKGYDLKYMFCCTGDKDIAYEDQKDVMEKTLLRCPELIEGINYEFFVVPGGTHDMEYWQLHLYHALQIFFKN